jgi:hypothetical protein
MIAWLGRLAAPPHPAPPGPTPIFSVFKFRSSGWLLAGWPVGGSTRLACAYFVLGGAGGGRFDSWGAPAVPGQQRGGLGHLVIALCRT